MDSETKNSINDNPLCHKDTSEDLHVKLCAVCDIVDQFSKPACLMNAKEILYANAPYKISMAGVDFRTFAADGDISDKEFIIDNTVFLVHIVRLNTEYLLVTLTEKEDLRLSIDPLTGLLNRESFHYLITNTLETSRVRNQMMTVLFIDLDGFKAVNDTYGHDKGDIVLKVVGERLSKIIRDKDLCFRLGGDEFIILLRDIKDRLHPCLVARRIIHSISQNIIFDESNTVKVGVSIGISTFPHDGNDPEELLKNADDAMYRAKKLGKNNYQLSGQ